MPPRPPTSSRPSSSDGGRPPTLMTGPSTAPIPVVGTPSGEPTTAVASGGEGLHPGEGLELLGEVPGSGYRQAPALAPRGDGQVITLTPLLHQTVAAID